MARKSPAQLQREIDEALNRRGTTVTRARRARPRPARAARSTHHATRKETSDKINIDQLAKLFDLPPYDDIEELNSDNIYDAGQSAYDEDEDASETAREAAREKAEWHAQAEIYGQWYDAVKSVASQLFEEHGLELTPTGKQGDDKRRYDFKIEPAKSWDEAANKIRETVNGVGYFHFNTLREFLDSGPYTARQAVLSHLEHIASYPAVYGSSSARSLYENAW